MGSPSVPSSSSEVPSIRHPGALRTGVLLAAFSLGALALLPTVSDLVQMWRVDALRSVGAYLVLVAMPLIVLCWARIDWESRGSWWGLPLIVATCGLSYVTAGGWFLYRTGNFLIQFLQPGLLLFGMGAGIVLLLGGTRLLRAAIFPLCLLLLANPVPHSFNRFVDLPLQQISAQTARGFSHLLGLHPSGKDLLMMFTPHFGMMIVPGCNGIRGAVTMFYLAMVLAWLEGFRAWKIALCSLGALALGYVLNLLRLCLLVVYYWIGVHHPAWQGHGEGVDYLIGGTIFFAVAMLFGATFFDRRPLGWRGVQPAPRRFRPQMVLVSLGALCVLAGAQVYAQWGHLRFAAGYVSLTQAKTAVPLRVGPWFLQRTWAEADAAGTPVWQWAEFRREGVAQTVRIGLWLSPVQHFALMSEQAHGRTALWTSGFDAHDAAGLPLHFSTFAGRDADDLSSVAYAAEAQCRADGCGSRISGFSGQGFSFAFGKPGRGKHLEMVIRVPGIASRDGDAVATEFASYLDVRGMVERAGSD